MNEVFFNFLVVIGMCFLFGAAMVAVSILANTLRNSKYDRINDQIQIFVKAAQQVYNIGDGQRKKEEVVERMQEWLDSRGIKLNAIELDALIEKAVYDLKHN